MEIFKCLNKIIILISLSVNVLYCQSLTNEDSIMQVYSAKMAVIQEIVSNYELNPSYSFQVIFDSIMNKSNVRFLKHNSDVFINHGQFSALEVRLTLSEGDSISVFNYVVGFWKQKKGFHALYRLKLKGFYQNDFDSFTKFMIENNFSGNLARNTIRLIRENFEVETMDIDCLTEYISKKVKNKYYRCMVSNSELVNPIIIHPYLKKRKDIARYDKLQTVNVHLMGIPNKNPLKYLKLYSQ